MSIVGIALTFDFVGDWPNLMLDFFDVHLPHLPSLMMDFIHTFAANVIVFMKERGIETIIQ